ncbi:sensor histidine kinase [Aureimonas ureilytica]|uniref:sensor histidine kinase n=1 Tax=Aureimonas ureilytica TaxID=401562 RepID=UPI00039FA546|nr:HWE histidine kinase domain-containing protein [Aureimonas ureilytica]
MIHTPHSASRQELLAEIARLQGVIAALPIAPPQPDGETTHDQIREIAEMRAEAASYLRAARRLSREDAEAADLPFAAPEPADGERVAASEPAEAASEASDLASRLRRSEAARLMSEERLALAFEASGSLGWWDWDLKADKVYAGPYFARMFGVSPAEAEAGVPLRFFVEGIHPEDRERVAASIQAAITQGSDFSEDYRLFNRQTGTTTWLHARGRAFNDAEGRPLRFPGVAIDTTAYREGEERKAALVALGERLRELHEVGAIAFAAAEAMATQLRATRAGFGVVDPIRETVQMQPDWRLPGVVSLAGLHHFRDYGSFIDDLKRGETVLIEDVATDPRTGAHHASLEAIGIRVLLNVPIMDHGQFSAVMFVHYDRPHRFSEAELRFVRTVADRAHAEIGRCRAEERERMLNHELSHRLKNTLAMVQAIAAQTLRNAPDMPTARETLGNRLAALSRAHDLLLGRSRDAADIRAVVGDTLALHDDGQDRIRLSGPALDIGSDAALSMTLILHELATNAVKYGSLSVPEGKVDLAWSTGHREGADVFELVWRESGGPKVADPSRRGFGSRLIERGLPGSVGGSVEQSYAETGLVCRIAAPLSAIQSGD